MFVLWGNVGKKPVPWNRKNLHVICSDLRGYICLSRLAATLSLVSPGEGSGPAHTALVTFLDPGPQLGQGPESSDAVEGSESELGLRVEETEGGWTGGSLRAQVPSKAAFMAGV